MKKLLLSLLTITAFGFGANAQCNDTITPPTLTASTTGWDSSGVQISVITNCILEEVVFENRGNLDTLKLYTNAMVELASMIVPSGNSSFTWNLNYTLNPLDTVWLVSLKASNQKYASFGLFPKSNSHISVDRTIQIGGPSLLTYWFSYSKIITSNCNVGIKKNSKSTLSIHPNPATFQLTLNTSEQIKSINIIDITGKVVKTIVSNNNTIDVSGLTKGIYFLQVQTENRIMNSKFIKE